LLLIFAFDRAITSAPVQHLYYLSITFAAVMCGIRGGVRELGSGAIAVTSCTTRGLGGGHSHDVHVSPFLGLRAVHGGVGVIDNGLRRRRWLVEASHTDAHADADESLACEGTPDLFL
jgi:hypothetical protein